MMMETFEAAVCGISAQIEITSYTPGRPAKLYGPMEDCYPEEPAEVEIRVRDRNGYPAPWLQDKLERDSDEEERIYRMAVEHMEER